MALEKKQKFKNGTSANYHKISSIEIVPYVESTAKRTQPENCYKIPDVPVTQAELIEERGYKMIVHVCSFVSQEIRQEDERNYINSFSKTKKIKKEEFNSSDIFAQAYNFLKEDTIFKESKDV